MYEDDPNKDDAFGFSGVGFVQFGFASVDAFGRCDEGVELADVCSEWPWGANTLLKTTEPPKKTEP